MGPSILAAAFTTISAAVVMMFTTILFFQRFAVILFYSLLMGLGGSMIVFLVLTDTFGPSQPTYCMDGFFNYVRGCCTKQMDEDAAAKSGKQRPQDSEDTAEKPETVSTAAGKELPLNLEVFA